MNTQPHMSYALRQLRTSVTICSLIVAAAAVVQMLIFGFVHYTDVRWETIQETTGGPVMSVVQREGQKTLAGRPAASRPSAANARPVAAIPDVNRVASRWDGVLNHFSNIAVMVGIVTALALAVLTFLGVCIGAGGPEGGVPGVEKAVTACSWAVILALMCLPWAQMLPSAPLKGVFSPYEVLAAASDVAASGTGGSTATATLHATHLLLPLMAGVVAMLVLARFREGVAEGAIVQSVSEMDERLEREMAEIRRTGVSSNIGARTGSSLDRAIVPPPEPRPIAQATAAPPTRGVKRPNPGDPERRPI